MFDEDEREPFDRDLSKAGCGWGQPKHPWERIYELLGRPFYFDDGFVSPELRAAIYARDGYRCLRCREEDDLQIDHVQPWSRGGYTTEANLQTLCGRCNRWKGTREIDFRPASEPGPFDLDLSATADWGRFDEVVLDEEPLSLEEQFRKHQERHLLWCWWVQGDLPGYPDDEAALSRAQALIEQRIKDERDQGSFSD